MIPATPRTQIVHYTLHIRRICWNTSTVQEAMYHMNMKRRLLRGHLASDCVGRTRRVQLTARISISFARRTVATKWPTVRPTSSVCVTGAAIGVKSRAALVRRTRLSTARDTEAGLVASGRGARRVPSPTPVFAGGTAAEVAVSIPTVRRARGRALTFASTTEASTRVHSPTARASPSSRRATADSTTPSSRRRRIRASRLANFFSHNKLHLIKHSTSARPSTFSFYLEFTVFVIDIKYSKDMV